MPLAEGQMLGLYRIEAPMGQGGMATIYRATQQRLGRVVAIKMLHPVFVQDAGFLARFEREAQIVAQLDHPHIVPVYDFSDYNGQPYLVMKYIDGTTLKMAQEEHPLPPNEILRVLTPIAAALDYAHQQGVLHRDIKPSNILLAGDGTPYLTDFGLARMAALGSSTLSGDMMLGTPHYISPEQALGSQNLTAATDLYSFGVILYELVTGRVPFTGDTPYAIVHAHIYDPLPAPRSLNPALSPAVEAVLVKALSKEPAARYPSATALIEAYRAALAAPATAPAAELAPPAAETPAAAGIFSGLDPFDALTETVTLPPEVAVASPVSTPIEANADDEKPKRTVVETSFDLSQVGDSLREVGEQIKESFEGFGEGGSETDDDLAPPGDEAALRRRVERQIKKKNGFWKNLLAYVVVIPILWVIYGMIVGVFGADASFPLTLTQFPWPAVVMLGWAAGLAGDAIDTWHSTGARAARRIVRLHEAFRAEYGPQWYRTAPRRELKAIRKRVEKPYRKWIAFYKNLASFAFVIPMLWVIYGFVANTATLNIGIGGDSAASTVISLPWPLIIMFFWGLGLINDGLSVRSAMRAEKHIEREMERQRSLVDQQDWPDEKAKNDFNDEARLAEDGELSDSVAREIERAIKRGSR